MDTFSFHGTMQFIKKHGKLLCIVFFVSAIISALISLLLPNYYKSEVLLLPSATNAVSKPLLSENYNTDPFMFGTEKESEYILEILSSWQIIEKTAAKFNLREHYGLSNSPLDNEKMLLRLQKNIKVKRSDYMGAKLRVWDKDPKYACDIANYMVSELQSLRRQMRKEKADSILSAMQTSKKRVQAEIIELTDSLRKLQNESNMYYPTAYADRFAQEMSKRVAAGDFKAVERLEQKLRETNSNGPLITALLNDIENKSKMMITWDEHYQQALVDLDSNIPVDFVAQYATISYKKDKPKRSIIVILAALACTLIAAEYFVIKEKSLSSTSNDGQNDKA